MLRQDNVLRCVLLSPKLIEMLAKVLHYGLVRMLSLVHHLFDSLKITQGCHHRSGAAFSSRVVRLMARWWSPAKERPSLTLTLILILH